MIEAWGKESQVPMLTLKPKVFFTDNQKVIDSVSLQNTKPTDMPSTYKEIKVESCVT